MISRVVSATTLILRMMISIGLSEVPEHHHIIPDHGSITLPEQKMVRPVLCYINLNIFLNQSVISYYLDHMVKSRLG